MHGSGAGNMPRVIAAEFHYVLLCARQYAATLLKLRLASNPVEKCQHIKMLHYLMESAIGEADVERGRREAHLADDIKEFLTTRDSAPVGRAVSSQEVELVRRASAVPPVATLESLSGHDLLALADVYEGWAQDARNDSVTIARLLGWADGGRALVEAVGVDYTPPPRVQGEPMSLLGFLAHKIRE